MAEVVSSIWCLRSSSSKPLRGLDLFNASISALVVLKMMASSSEHQKEVAMVKMTARTNQSMSAV